jgi:hypothetical protein
MQRHSYTICFALTALALTVLGLNAPATGSEEVQFEGKFDLAFTRFSAAGFPIVSSFYEGSGEASHLGKSTVEGRIDKNLSTGLVTSSGTVTAADGDQLFFDATYQKSATADPNTFTLKVTLKITGGTGRFEGVTGDGFGTGKFNSSTLKGMYTLNGTAARPPM